jgi:flagellar basal-body rod protein FlgF
VLGDPSQDLYTRTGMFHLDSNRQVVTSDGYPLLQENGRPLVIPQGAQRITITGDGVVTTEQGEVGRIRLVRFASEQAMRVAGSGEDATDQTPLPATDAKVTQGALESSNVQPVLEMTSLIQLSQNYQMIQNMLDTEHTRMQQSVSRIMKA